MPHGVVYTFDSDYGRCDIDTSGREPWVPGEREQDEFAKWANEKAKSYFVTNNIGMPVLSLDEFYSARRMGREPV